MSRHLLALCAACAAILCTAGCSATTSTGQNISHSDVGVARADTSELVRIDSIWVRNYATNDTATADKLMAADFFMTSGNGRTKTKAQEMGDIRPTAGLRMLYARTEGVHVHVYGAVGVVSGFGTWSFEQNGSTPVSRIRYTAIYTRGGPLGWQLKELHVARAS